MFVDADAQPACAIDPELFFSPDISGSGVDRYRMARKICDRCDFKTECLEAALTLEAHKRRDDIYGVYGGLSPLQRFKLLKQRRADEHGAEQASRPGRRKSRV